MMKLPVLVAIAAGVLFATPAAVQAETTFRAHGRCRLKVDHAKVYDGHCKMVKKQHPRNEVFVVDLDGGLHYRFRGQNDRELNVETVEGVYDAQVRRPQDNRLVFTWQRHRLVFVADSVHEPDPSVSDDKPPSLGESLGKALGTALGNLIFGGNRDRDQAQPTNVATANIPCSLYTATHSNQCAVRVERKTARTGVLYIKRPDGRERVINYRPGENMDRFEPTDGAEARVGREDDTYYVSINGEEFYIVPQVLLTGD